MTASTDTARGQRAPRMSRLALLKYIPSLLSRREQAVRTIAERYGPLVRLPIPGSPFYLVSSPEYARRVLHTNAKNYRRSFDHRIVRDFLGDGVLSTHDDAWRFIRRSAQAPLLRPDINAWSRDINAMIEQAGDSWIGTDAAPWAATEHLTALTLRIFVHVVLGIEKTFDVKAAMDGMDAGLKYVEQRLTAVVDLAARYRTPRRKRFERVLATFDAIVDSWIAEGRGRPDREDAGGDLLDALLRSSTELPDDVDPDHWLRSQIKTLLAAGHETTAVALSWASYLLARHPERIAALRAELDTVVGPDALPDAAQCQQLPRQSEFLREAMRLYPPVWSMGREAIAADHFAPYAVPAGSTVMVSSYVIHRDANAWPEPDAFKPERFAERPIIEKGLGDFTYIPFGAGPRFCMGERLATLELHGIFSYLLRLELSLAKPGPIGIRALISLRPHPDVELVLGRRKEAGG